MADDLIERLRAAGDWVNHQADSAPAWDDLLLEAADEIERLREQTTWLGVRVQQGWAKIEELTEALAPFVAYYRVSMASRNPDMPDSLGVATHTNTVDGDTSITVGDLRRASGLFPEDS